MTLLVPVLGLHKFYLKLCGAFCMKCTNNFTECLVNLESEPLRQGMTYISILY
jgi:hypothetical protein